MNNIDKLNLAAHTDSSFTLNGRDWTGKCLICNGPISFDARTGEGATVEHIRARSRGGDDSPSNLAVVHGSCNAEKGRHWDRKQLRSDSEYEKLVSRFLARRKARWRDWQRVAD